MNLTAEEIARACGGELVCDKNIRINDITTDSRKAKSGSLFIALVGERFDGHDFIGSVFEAGANLALVNEGYAVKENQPVIKVENTLTALGDIAKYYKEKFTLRTIAVTGSVGKTTTKDMLSSVLSEKYNTLTTRGNFNNNIGMPLTIFNLDETHETALLEMGMNNFGEIHYLANIARPDTAIISNIGMSHIENLGSRGGILKAKLEICDFFDDKSTLIINGDDDMLYPATRNMPFKVISFGIENPQADVRAYDIEDKGTDGVEFSVKAGGAEHRICVRTAGAHNVYNALAAICAGIHYGIDMERIKAGIANFTPTGMRMSIEDIGGVTVINDCYNSSPASVEAALKVLNGIKAERRVAILGDMLEMGSYAKDAHFNTGVLAAKYADCLLCAGKESENTKRGAEEKGMSETYIFENSQTLAGFAAEYVKKGDAVLIKASRGMKFENVYNTLKEKI